MVSNDVLTVRFGRWPDLAAQEPHLKRGGLFVPPPAPLPSPYVDVALIVIAPNARQVELRARVVQIAPGAGIALASDDPQAIQSALEPLLGVARAGATEPDLGPVEVRWGRPVVTNGACSIPPAQSGADVSEPVGVLGEPDPPVAEPLGAAEENGPAELPGLSSDSATLHDQIRAMTTSEKIRVALHGDRGARLLLLKDPNKTIHLYLLQNKRITLDEVLHIAGHRQANPEALSRIGESREWIQNPGVLAALVANPKTPTRTSIRLMRNLPQSELRRLAKSQSVPQAIAQAARKLIVSGS